MKLRIAEHNGRFRIYTDERRLDPRDSCRVYAKFHNGNTTGRGGRSSRSLYFLDTAGASPIEFKTRKAALAAARRLATRMENQGLQAVESIE